MSQLQQQKRVEAAAQLKQAEKALTRRSFFCVSPNYLSAAPLLNKVGELFRLGNDWEASGDAFRRFADAQQHNQQAQAEGSIRTMSSQKSRTGEARQAFEKAGGFYVVMGEFGKAADALVKDAQTCESQGSSVDDVLPLYTHACELLGAQDKPHFAVETLCKMQAMDQPHNVHKCRLSQVILHLASGDKTSCGPLKRATKTYCELRYGSRDFLHWTTRLDAFLSSNGCVFAEDLVWASKTGNEDLLRATVRKPGFLALDNQIGRVSRKLSIYGLGDAAAGGAKPRGRHQHGTAPSSSGKRTQEQQQSGKQRNPFAPSARAPCVKWNSFTSISRAPAQAPVPSLTSDDYEAAALSEALGAVAVTKQAKTHSRSASVPKCLQPASPEPVGLSLSLGLSPIMASSSSPAAVRASACMDFGCDDLEYAMPDSDSLGFSMDEPIGVDVGERSDSFGTPTAPASKTRCQCKNLNQRRRHPRTMNLISHKATKVIARSQPGCDVFLYSAEFGCSAQPRLTKTKGIVRQGLAELVHH
uniref:Gamma-soluble NSF attachment protein n=1 Tax=Peronospora matthiolae TaxID=2874970 RepID=A0AAV1TQC4_9STRA